MSETMSVLLGIGSGIGTVCVLWVLGGLMDHGLFGPRCPRCRENKIRYLRFDPTKGDRVQCRGCGKRWWQAVTSPGLPGRP